ncbi:MAG TPA: phosphohydrolase [Planctomycetota bacterium]|nr:phosphohydrolase [Planctomycetota bacterium]
MDCETEIDTEARRGGWMQTFTGRQFWPLDPKPEDVCIEDIAHALALKCRFGSHSREFYSVAQHSVYVAQIVPSHLQMRALLHDAAEAYLPDVGRPIKGRLSAVLFYGGDFNVVNFKNLESRVLFAIAGALGVCGPFDFPEIKYADDVLLATEARDLMAEPPVPWHPLPEALPFKLEAWGPGRAESEFLRAYERLRDRKW